MNALNMDVNSVSAGRHGGLLGGNSVAVRKASRADRCARRHRCAHSTVLGKRASRPGDSKGWSRLAINFNSRKTWKLWIPAGSVRAQGGTTALRRFERAVGYGATATARRRFALSAWQNASYSLAGTSRTSIGVAIPHPECAPETSPGGREITSRARGTDGAVQADSTLRRRKGRGLETARCSPWSRAIAR